MKKLKLHEYVVEKLEEDDYHAVADAAMDLRELAREIKVLKEINDERNNPHTNEG
jgi:hypothetical protein